MSTPLSIDVIPLGRLLRPRVALGIAGLGIWVLGLGWIGLAARFNARADYSSDEAFARLLVAAAVVMLPAFCGAVFSEAMHEALRRPMIHMLPNVRQRLRSSTWFFAALVTVLLATGLSLLWPGLEPYEAAGPALLGVAVGSWVMVRMGGGAFWFVRLASLAALAYFAGPLCSAAAGSPLAALVLGLVGAALLVARLRPEVLGASLFSDSSTMLTVLSDRGRKSAAPHSPGALAPLPPAELGGSLEGWMAAHRFEQESTRSRIGTFAGLLRLAVFVLLIAFVGPLVLSMIEGGGALRNIADTLVGLPRDAASVGEAAPNSLILFLLMYGGMAAVFMSVPLWGNLLFPMSRSMYARLAFRVALTTFAHVFLATLVAGTAASAIVLTIGGYAWPSGLPTFAWAALAILIVMPWIQVVVHTASRFSARTPLFALVGLLPLTLFAFYVPLTELRAGWDEHLGAVPAWQVVLAYVALLAASLASLRTFLGWHFRTCDLVRR